MKKKIIIPIIILVTILMLLLILKPNKKIEYTEVPEGYIAVFHGGAGEITYSTYIYKIENDKPNYGFKYINTTNTTESWGSSNWIVKITDSGEFGWTGEAFIIAKKNHAYGYVTIPGEEGTYTIEEFQNMFIMN